MGLKVDTQHREYEANIAIWNKVDAAAEGKHALDAMDIAAPDTFIPKPNPTDISDSNKERYKQLVKRSCYVNIVGRTISSFTGQVFAKDPEMDLPTDIENFQDDIDGAGVSLIQQSRRMVERGLRNGRGGLLVDYSKAPEEGEGERKQQDAIDGRARPTIIAYPAKSVINWKSERFGSKELLTLVAISYQESVEDPDDRFVVTYEDRVLELALEDGVYVQRVYAKTDNDSEEEWEQVGDDVVPTKGTGGQTFNYIPFTFVGSVNNDAEVDKAPVGDLADVNISHRSNSADLEESSYYSSGFTPVANIGDWDKKLWEDANGNSIRYGPLGGVLVPKDGSMEYLQPDPATLPQTIMELKEKQMGALGARIVEPQQQAITATESSSNTAAQTSVLSTVAKNVSSAYEQCFRWWLEFTGGQGEPKFQLSSDYDISRLDAQTLLAVVQAFQQGILSKPDAIGYTRDVGLTDKTFEEVEQEIEENPSGLELTTAGQDEGSIEQ